MTPLIREGTQEGRMKSAMDLLREGSRLLNLRFDGLKLIPGGVLASFHADSLL